MNLLYRTRANAQAIATIYNKPLDKPEWFKVVAAKDNEEAQILLFDYVGWPYNDPRDLIHALADIGDVVVRINSPGGDVFDGASIFNSLASHKGTVTTRVEGLAASIASVIAMAGKKVQAYDNTMLMIHNAWTFTMGNQYEMRETADLLEKIDGNILDAYQNKSKKGKKAIADMMKETTWMTAKEAKENGFIDEIVTGKLVKANFNLSIFANLPEEFLDIEHPTFTGFDVEKAMRDAKAPKGFAKAVAAACRAAKLVDRCHADDNSEGDIEKEIEAAKQAGINELKAEIEKITSKLKQ